VPVGAPCLCAGQQERIDAEEESEEMHRGVDAGWRREAEVRVPRCGARRDSAQAAATMARAGRHVHARSRRCIRIAPVEYRPLRRD
jgi:hypothetical protein